MTKAEELERRILIKKQLMELTNKELDALEEILRREKARIELLRG
jgi:hypothetical protein